ncbi:MAG: hypothetical protein IPP82_14985 [Xanthomonadales bacterium]|nr:hypothetical protein [Xanthomonadales bacterium]
MNKPPCQRLPSLLAVALLTCVGLSAGCNAEPGFPMQERSTQARAANDSPQPAGVFVAAKPRKPSLPATANGALQKTSIEDPAGFRQPLTAYTLTIPQAWQPHGAVSWNRGVECISNMLSIDWTAISPDGLQAFSILPRLTWQVSSATIVEMYPCPAAPMRSAREYLQALVQNARPGARVLSYRDRPDMIPPNSAPPPGMNGRQWTEAGEILIAYPLQGHDMRESITASVFFSEMDNPMIGRSISASSSDALALRAPDGQLDFSLLARIAQSLHINPAWNQQVLEYGKRRSDEISQRQSIEISNWHQRRMNEITTAGILERGRIRMDAIQAVGRINNQIVAGRDASGERQQAARIDTIQEVQPWRDPATGSQVDLSIHYQHAWQLDDGRQFLTNDPNFNPYQSLGINGHALEPARN